MVRPSLASTHSPFTKFRSRSMWRTWHDPARETRDSVVEASEDDGNACTRRRPLAVSARASRPRTARRPEQGDRRTAAGRRPQIVRGDRARGRPVRGGGPAAGAAAARGRRDADRRRDRSAAGRLRPPGDDRRQRGRRPARRGGQAVRAARGRLRRHHRRLVRHPARGRVRGRRAPARPAQRLDPKRAGRARHRDVRLPTAGEADLHLGNAMTTTPQNVTTDGTSGTLSERARRHLWMHFTRMASYADPEVPVIVRREGAYVWDDRGKRYLEGLSGLFVTQVGHGRHELANAAGKQAGELAYYPLWSYAHAPAVELAERIAGLA